MTVHEDPQAVWHHADAALTTALTDLRATPGPGTRAGLLAEAGRACLRIAGVHRAVFGAYQVGDGMDRADGYTWMANLYILLADTEAAAHTRTPRTPTGSALEPVLGPWLRLIAADGGLTAHLPLLPELQYAATPIVGRWAASNVFSNFPHPPPRTGRRRPTKPAVMVTTATGTAAGAGAMLITHPFGTDPRTTVGLILILLTMVAVAVGATVDLFHTQPGTGPDTTDRGHPWVRRDWQSW